MGITVSVLEERIVDARLFTEVPHIVTYSEFHRNRSVCCKSVPGNDLEVKDGPEIAFEVPSTELPRVDGLQGAGREAKVRLRGDNIIFLRTVAGNATLIEPLVHVVGGIVERYRLGDVHLGVGIGVI